MANLVLLMAHPFHNRSAEQQATREALLASRLQTETPSSALIPSRGEGDYFAAEEKVH